MTDDLDPNDLIELEHDPTTDTETDPANDDAGTPGEIVDGAVPVDDGFTDLDLPTVKED